MIGCVRDCRSGWLKCWWYWLYLWNRFYVWKYINQEIKPALGEMHMQLIRVIDQFRMLDQDLIRLQQKVNVVLEYRERQAVLEDAKEKEALEKVREQEGK